MNLLGISPGELALLAVAIVFAGALTGVFAGLLGIGGAAISVPVMYEIFRLVGVSDDVRMQLCVGTALALIVPTSIRSYFAHRSRGAVDDSVLRRWAIPIVLGVCAGAGIAYFASANFFKLIFSVLALLMAARLLFGRESWRLGKELPGTAGMSATGFGIGLISALMGIGGGAYATMVMTLYGRTIHQSIATSAGVGVLISVPGVVGYMLAGLPHQALMPPLSVGYVSFLAAALFAPSSVLAAPYGARLAHSWPRRRLEIAFAIFLMTISFRFLASLFGWF
jgi:uncharacterized membrane protein YfcA